MKADKEQIAKTFRQNFRSIVRGNAKSGTSVNLDESLEIAVILTARELRWWGVKDNNVRDLIKDGGEEFREEYRRIILDTEKSLRLLDIRKTGLVPILADFVKKSGLDIRYEIHDNSQVVFYIKMGKTQILIVRAAFSKILSNGWLDEFEQNIKDYLEVSARLGNCKVVNRKL